MIAVFDHCSQSDGSSPKKDPQSSVLSERRRSSLGHTSEASEAVTDLRRRGHSRNQSSPEIELQAVLKSPEGGNQGVKSPESLADVFDDERRLSEGTLDRSPTKQRELSSSVTSSTSIRSDATLPAEDSEERDKRARSETAETITRERSESSMTLQNEKDEEDGQGGQRYHMSVAFRQQLLNTIQVKTDSRIGVEVAKLSDPELDIVQLLGRCLPHIVPNVILAKREVRAPRARGCLQLL